MLGQNGNDREILNEVVERLNCDVRLPDSWGDFFSESGPLPPDSRRQYARWRIRGYAALQYHQTAPALVRSPCWHRVFVKDISRGGIGFLHSEQLFPLEQMRIILPDTRLERLLPNRLESVLEVTRCLRIQKNCYEVGARFVGSEA